jgi:hypothetical protein
LHTYSVQVGTCLSPCSRLGDGHLGLEADYAVYTVVRRRRASSLESPRDTAGRDWFGSSNADTPSSTGGAFAPRDYLAPDVVGARLILDDAPAVFECLRQISTHLNTPDFGGSPSFWKLRRIRGKEKTWKALLEDCTE